MSAVKRLSDDSVPQAKKAKFERSQEPLEELSDGGLLSQDDVLYYQKEAIYRMLNLARHRNQRLRRELGQLNLNYTNLRDYYTLLNGWWSQIVDELNNAGVDVQDVDSKVLLAIPEASDDDSKQYAADLEEKRAKLVALLQPLLSQPVANRDDKIADLQDSVSSLNSFKQGLQDENRLLKEKIDELNLELDKYVTSIERKASKTLQRIADVHEDKESSIEPEQAKGESNGAVKKEDVSEEFKKAKEEIDDLKVKLAGLLSENKAQAEQLTDRSSKVANLESAVTQLKGSLTNLSEEELAKIPNYLSVVSKNSELSSQLSKLKFDTTKISNQFQELEAKLTQNRAKLQAQLKAEVESNNGYIAKLEGDINRIRSDRDALLAKVNVLKAEKGKSELTEEYRKLTESLQSRLAELESKETPDVSNTSDDVDTLKKINAAMSRELKQLEQAYKSVRGSTSDKLAKYAEAESYMNKLEVEKVKADEKYFQAMRSKDALSMQNKILNTNVAKQSELIETLRNNEKKLHQKLEIEEQLYEKMKQLETVYNNEQVFQKTKNKELETKLRSLHENNSQLQADNVKKQEDISTKDKKILQLESHEETLQSKLNQQTKIVERYRSNSRTAEDEEINQALLTMTKCQLCNKNFKNVTLKTCGHCFCSDCIQNRLASRMRKCPNCNCQFSSYDLLEIHL